MDVLGKNRTNLTKIINIFEEECKKKKMRIFWQKENLKVYLKEQNPQVAIS
jgi:hypothetical protein